MADELPDGVTVETVYAVEISYAPDAAVRRGPVRQEHLTRIAELLASGRLVEAGGYLDFSAAMLLVRAESADEAIALVRDDVYLRSGVWVDDARARAYGRVVTAANRR